LDYQNVRANYVTAFMNNLVNWDFVNAQIPK
jgi:superoxide dismutase